MRAACRHLALGLALASLASVTALSGCSPPGFFHGVASGDPWPDAVVIWTRFTPPNENSTTESFPVQWTMSKDANNTQVVASGNVIAAPAGDFTVKVDVEGLEPDTRYFYHFVSGNVSSPLGLTRTAPAPGSARTSLRFAISSCASWRFGYFNVMNLTAQIRDIDFLLFLGDWIYEYGTEQYPTPPVDKVVREGLVPTEHDTFTLADYRARHRLHRTDVQSQEMSRRVPIIVTWDDHDLADNAWKNGSLDQQRATDAGVTYQQRMQNAVQAFYEYLPIRDPPPPITLEAQLRGMYRALTFGDLATLITTDQRFLYRTEPLDQLNTAYVQALANNDPDTLYQDVPNLPDLRWAYYTNLTSPANVMIGQEQLDFMTRDFGKSVDAGVTWQLYADQVIMGTRRTPDVQQAIDQMYSGIAGFILGNTLELAADQLSDALAVFTSARVLVSAGAIHDALLTDGWDGYQAERDTILRLFQQLGARGGNPVSLAGDSHNAWAYELPAENNGTGAMAATEFCTASVTPPGLERGLGAVPGVDLPAVMVQGMYLSNDQLKYAQITHRGLVALTATRERLHADFLFVDSIDKQGDFQPWCDRSFEVQAGQPGRLLNATCTPTEQLLIQFGTPDDPLAGFGLAQPARSDLAIASNCTESPPEEGQEQGQGIIQRVGSAISGLFG